MSKPETHSAVSRKDIYSGLTFVGLAALFAGHSMLHTIGTPLRMGPGFFPLIVALLMGAMGLLIIVQAWWGERPAAIPDKHDHHPIPWKGAVLVLGGPIVFALTIVGLGLVPATALVVLMAAFASPDMGWRGALLSTVMVTLGCLAIFSWGLGLPLRLFGTWIV